MEKIGGLYIMKEDKKSMILEKGIELFSETGYLKTTVEDITNSLNISKGSFYTYFDSKETLLLGIINYLHNQHIETTKEISLESKGLSVKETLKLYINSSIQKTLRSSNIISLVQQVLINDFFKVDAVKRMIPDFKRVDKKFMEEYIFKKLDKNGKDIDSELLIDYIITSIQMFLLINLKENREYIEENKEKIIEDLSSFILYGICGILKEEV